MTSSPKTTRHYAVPAGHYPFNSKVYPVYCVEQRGRFYASMNTLNASPIESGDTIDEAFDKWAQRCNARRAADKPQ